MPSIRSRRVMLPEGERPATVRYEDGVVVHIGDGGADIDAGDLVVMPGLVDTHVHVNEPGRTRWEGFATATRAGAAGGTTTIVDMPLNSLPPTVDVPALERKRAAAEASAGVDVAFWGGVVPGSEGSIGPLAANGVCGFKVFLVDSGVPEFAPIELRDLARVSAEVAIHHVPLLVHAEHSEELRSSEGDTRRYSTYLASRPAAAEARAIDDVVETVVDTGCRAHILHVAGSHAVDAIERGRSQAGLTAETCPHYLTFDAEGIADGRTEFKCAPPIRTADDREALWEALSMGVVDMVVSDHSPAPPHLKDPAGGDFMEAWGGIASVELRLVATWDGARRRGIPLGSLVRWLAEAPADLAGLGHRKGRIAVGHDADLVVFDPDAVTSVDAVELRQRHPITPYDGMTLAGSVVATFLGGRPIVGPGTRPGPGGRLLRRDA